MSAERDLLTGDGRLHYRVEGEGPAILWLPGAGANHTALMGLSRSIPGRRHLLPDPRGMGSTPRGEGELTVSRLAADAHALLVAEAAQPAVVVGHSLGTAVAQELERSYPRSVSALVLLAPWREHDAFLERQRTLVSGIVSRSEPPVYADAVIWFLVSRRMQNEAPQAVETMKRSMFLGSRCPDPGALVESLLLSRTFAFDPERAPRVPTLVMAGEEDRMTPWQNARDLSASIPGSRWVLVTGPGSSHLFHVERVAEVLEAIRAFLADAGV